MKKNKKVMTTMGILTMCGIGAGTYMYMNKNKKKMQDALTKYMTYQENER